MKHKNKTFIFMTLMFMSFSIQNLFAQTKLSVDDAVTLASDNNLSLKRQKISLDMLEKRNNYSWNSITPSASISGNFSKPLDSEEYSYSITGSVSLNFTPSLITSITSAKLNYESGKISYETAAKTIELNVRKTFYSLIYEKESIALKKRNMETAKIRYENNRDKYNRGQFSELDLLQSQYNYESMLPSIESAEITYENNLASFKQTLGLSPEEKIELEGSLAETIPADSFSIETPVEDLPSIKKIEASIEQQKNSLTAARMSAYEPSLSLSYSYGKALNNYGVGLQTTGNSLGVSVRIPLDGLFPWSNSSLNIDGQKANLADLELQLENEKATANITIQNSEKKIIQKQKQMELIKRNVEIAQKAYEMTLTAYNHGAKDLMTLQNSADSLMQARLDQQSLMYSLISDVLDLEHLLGVPFGQLVHNANTNNLSKNEEIIDEKQ